MRRLGWITGVWILIFSLALIQAREAFGQSPRAVQGSMGGREIGTEEIIAAMEAHLRKMIQDQSRRIEVRGLKGFERTQVSPGALSIEVLLPEQAVRGGNVAGMIALSLNGRELKKFPISARVDILADVLVAAHFLKRQQEIRPEDTKVVNKNIALLPPDVVKSEQEILGKRTTLSINGDEVLRASMLEIPPLVNKGDRVVLLFENAHLKITALGELMESGRRGDRVRLINLSSKREVYGKVLDSRTVQVDF